MRELNISKQQLNNLSKERNDLKTQITNIQNQYQGEFQKLQSTLVVYQQNITALEQKLAEDKKIQEDLEHRLDAELEKESGKEDMYNKKTIDLENQYNQKFKMWLEENNNKKLCNLKYKF